MIDHEKPLHSNMSCVLCSGFHCIQSFSLINFCTETRNIPTMSHLFASDTNAPLLFFLQINVFASFTGSMHFS